MLNNNKRTRNWFEWSIWSKICAFKVFPILNSIWCFHFHINMVRCPTFIELEHKITLDAEWDCSITSTPEDVNQREECYLNSICLAGSWKAMRNAECASLILKPHKRREIVFASPISECLRKPRRNTARKS